MSEFEIFFEMEGSQYGDGLMLSKYGDRYSIVAARRGKVEGTVYKDWCFPQDREKQPREKAIPLGVRIGDRAEAIKFAEWLLANLRTNGAKKAQSDAAPF